MAIPLHGKKAYAWIQLKVAGETLDFVNFLTGWEFDTDAENVSTAVICGSDVTLKEVHGISAGAVINMILGNDDLSLFSVYGIPPSNDDVPDNLLADYETATGRLSTEDRFHVSGKMDIFLAAMEDVLVQEDEVVSLEDIRGAVGYVYELVDAVPVSMRVTQNAGDFVRARLEAESGEFLIRNNEGA